MAGRLYVVAISHLDTQWRWTIRDTIRRHLPRTLHQNFERFVRFPSYVLSFDGALRYRLIEEYYPEEFERLLDWTRRGRWTVAGGWLDAADVNLPSPESLVRQGLYGVRYLVARLGVRPRDVFLPDCFGFGWALPSVAAHCGFHGFSSQKLSKGRAAAPIPFALGRWAGVDGAEIVAALEPGGYGEPLALPPASSTVGLRYFGVGDTGGAPDEDSLRRLEGAVAAPGRDVRTGPSGRLFDELAPGELEALPRHSGELLLNLHAGGCYTSQAAMKRWNRRNQALARSAEAASAAADWLGALAYPGAELRQAWERFLGHQFHDDLTGTSIPAAYEFSWNDELLALNQFARLLGAGVGAIAGGLDTRPPDGWESTPVVVWNPLEFERREAVEARLPARSRPSRTRLVVRDGQGGETPAQIVAEESGWVRLVFIAAVPPTGCAVFHAGWEQERPAVESEPGEGGFLSIEIDGDGRLARIGTAPGTGRLRRPVELELLADTSGRFPAWEIRHQDVAAAPRQRVGGPASIRLTERGPARLAFEVRRRSGRSEFVDTLRLTAGGELVDVESAIDWRSRKTLLKLAVSADVDSPVATYDLGLGAIERGVNSPSLWEVPAQGWADLSSGDGASGLAIFTDAKHGWDRPEPATLRLTLLHTPRVGRRFRFQGRQDLGVHAHRWGLWPHGRVSIAAIARRAACFEQPLIAFLARPHAGGLGRQFSFAASGVGDGGGDALLMALKKTEDGARFLLRLRETGGQGGRARVRFGGAVAAAAEVNGVEEPVVSALPVEIDGAEVAVALRGFQPRSLALSLAAPSRPLVPPRSLRVPLPEGAAAATWNADRGAADFDGRGRSYPAELLAERLVVDGVAFDLSGRRALACGGQEIRLPRGGEPRALHLLVAAVGGPVEATVWWAGGGELAVRVPNWTGFVGGWQQPIERTSAAWIGTHRHRRRGDDAYRFCYLWRLILEVPVGAAGVKLPEERRVRLFAASLLADPSGGLEAATALYD